MITKNQIKFLKSLYLKKNRNKYQKVIIEGYRLIEESIKGGADIEHIYFSDDSYNKYKNNKFLKINSYDIICNKDFNKVSDTKNSQGIIALVNIKKYYNSNKSNISSNIVVLDGIQDPGNLGTICRTCVWYGITTIVLTNNCINPFNSKCIRSGMGAHFYLENIIETTSKEIIEFCKDNNYSILVADIIGQNIRDISINNKWALVLGSEAHGTSDFFSQYKKITIKKFGDLESLNVSVASGILLDKLTIKK